MQTMTTEAVNDAVSAITERMMSELNRYTCGGIFKPITNRHLGIEAKPSDTYPVLRARVHAAAQRATFDNIRAAM